MHDEMITSCRKTCTEVDLLLHFGTSGNYDQKKRSSRDQCEFQCKTCGRWFSSFQALGGHTTSHKIRRRRSRGSVDGDDDEKMMMMMRKVKKAKSSHECSVCGVEFEMGQALGGHMRRHKPVMKKAAGTGTDQKKLFFLDLNLFPWENDHLLLQDHVH